LVQDRTKTLFENYDFIVSPTSPSTAFKIGDKSDNPIDMYLADVFTVHANIAGTPALSIPNGINENGMAIGFQVMANMHEDSKLLDLAIGLA
jgi:aspartyl-tRNA(Asn)/glutamyl-tRNA(Gln) amidotransferase subunit A